MDAKRTLIIVAHWDDEAISCGGIIQRRCAQIGPENVGVLYMHNRVYDYGKTNDDENQHIDMLQAKSILGYKHDFSCEFPEGEPYKVGFYSLLKEVETCLKSFDPTEVVIHSADDLNQDHRHLNHVCKIALRPVNLGRVKRVLEFFALDGTTKCPNFLVPVSEIRMNRKLDAIAAYSKEARTAGPRAPENIEAQARVWGSMLGMSYAEGFNLLLEKD